MNQEIKKIRWYMGPEAFDEAVRLGWIAGGAVRAAYANENISDVDIFFSGETARLSLEAELMELGYTRTFNSGNAVSWVKDFGNRKARLQTIKKYFDCPSACLNAFDFTVCQAAIIKNPENKPFVMQGPAFMQDLAGRQLIINRATPYPLSTVIRCQKYVKKGYTIRPCEMVQLLIQCARLKLETLQDWKDHLMGIDMVLLNALFIQMEKEAEGNPDTIFDVQRLMDMIDEYVPEGEDE